MGFGDKVPKQVWAAAQHNPRISQVKEKKDEAGF